MRRGCLQIFVSGLLALSPVFAAGDLSSFCRQWYEADLSFKKGKRGAKRLLYSNDKLIYVTTDHYKTFQEVPP